MKPWIVAALLCLSVLAGLLILTAPSRDSEPFSVYGIRKNHARYHRVGGETFTLEALMNDAEKLYGYEEAMTAHHIVGDDDQGETLALELVSLRRTPVQNGVRLVLRYSVPFETDKAHIHYDPAHLKITYRDKRTVTIPVGTFSYHFDEAASKSPHIDYEKITVMSDETPAGASAAGACITFRALSGDGVVIDGIDPGTPALAGNMDYLTVHDTEVTPFTPLEAVTGSPFNPGAASVNPRTATLDGHAEETLCVPFHRRNRLRSERFPFIITYMTGGTRHTLVIDDIRYMRSTGGLAAEIEEGARGTLEKD